VGAPLILVALLAPLAMVVAGASVLQSGELRLSDTRTLTGRAAMAVGALLFWGGLIGLIGSAWLIAKFSDWATAMKMT
jgi:hypothetical protein